MLTCVKTGVEQLDASNVLRSSESRCTKNFEKYVPKALEVPWQPKWSWVDLGPAWGANAVHLSRWETGCGVNDDVHASSCPSVKTSKAIGYYGDAIYKLEELGDMTEQSAECKSHLYFVLYISNETV